ncbi:Protein of unknown function [Cotesia congregata]|uniref:Reverse transcriptase domain-containing protein n=1 Tax=Cotesia congregata TaxID=51543 RepID=A0A8J2H805_COTCN|nr:Protein of unknown function [Cotesia congregata]
MGEDQIDVIVYVDDILIFAKTNEVIERIAKSLMKRFPITDLGVINHHLGVQRNVYFVTNDGLTKPELVNSGVGQGLVSAPLLFTLYTADGNTTIRISTTAKFLDIILNQRLRFTDSFHLSKQCAEPNGGADSTTLLNIYRVLIRTKI